MKLPPARLALPATLLLALGLARPLQDEPTVLGEGEHRYRWDGEWAAPGAEGLGSTHGALVIDAAGDVHASSDGRGCVLVFGPDGELARTWAEELGAGVHGMVRVEQDGEELFVLANAQRGEVVGATSDGEIAWRLGVPPNEELYGEDRPYRPTSVAVAPNGDLYVADGYGQGWIHRYDGERAYVGSFGGPGDEPGRFQTPHGIAIDTRVEPPELLVADRENGRLQAFSLEGELLRVLPAEVRRPCSIVVRGEDLVVADLNGRVTIVGPEGEVLVHLGDNPDAEQWASFDLARESWEPGVFFAPHHATWDADGNLYVMDWSRTGRVTRLVRLD